MSDANTDNLYTTEVEAMFNKDVLHLQANMVYNLAMNTHKSDYNNYRLLMGVANMLFMMSSGEIKCTRIQEYANTGIY